MSNEEAEAIEAYYDNRDSDKARKSFISRMEHKLAMKERHSRQ